MTRGDAAGSLPYLTRSCAAASVIRRVFARCLARHQRSCHRSRRHCRPALPKASSPRAQPALRASLRCQASPREHDPACRLAFSRAWSPHRTRTVDRRLVRVFAEKNAPDGGWTCYLSLPIARSVTSVVMIAALAPVIDLVMLDPNNPRSLSSGSIVSKRITGALPRKTRPAGYRRCSGLRLPSLRAAYADAAKITDAMVLDIGIADEALDAISSLITNNERSDAVWGSLA